MVQSRNGAGRSILRKSSYEREQGKGINNKPCVHCGGEHGLEECPMITEAELGEILIQLSGGKQGSMIFQDEEVKGSALKRHYLYLDTCSTED